MLSSGRHVVSDWNQQKIPYFSEPPTIHPSMIPSTGSFSVCMKFSNVLIEIFAVASTRNDTSGPTIAPGAEQVGQAQILGSFSKPFELEGIFGAADAGAFADGEGGNDIPMGMDDEDAAQGDQDPALAGMEGMEDGVPMESDDLKHIIPRKRERSPTASEGSAAFSRPLSDDKAAASRYTRQPKRQRRVKDIPDYESPVTEAHVLGTMSKSNPLSRKVLKREAKRVRKAQRVKGGNKMEVDEELQFTFMA